MSFFNKRKVLSELEKYSNSIERLSFDELKKMCFENHIFLSNVNLQSGNIENIESGLSGYLLFMLELYKVNNSITTKNILISISNDLVSYCLENKTHNFSLYTGRGGLIFFLLELYEQEKDNSILEKCLVLIDGAEEDFLESKYTSDYLYNGRSGFVLVLLKLYDLTKSPMILELLTKFVVKILNNAFLSLNGISWKTRDEININNSCGFTLGASGIIYVLNRVNESFSNESISFVINESNNFVQSCWSDTLNNWKNYEKDILDENYFALFLKQYNSKDSDLYEPNVSINWSVGSSGIHLIKKNIYNGIKISDLENLSPNIYEGISGIGLCMLNNKSDNSELLSYIFKLLLDNNHFTSLRGGLMYGDLGVNYFLLKSISINDDGNSICNPYKESIKYENEKLKINIVDIKEKLISKHYKRTIQFLNNVAPSVLKNYYKDRSECKNEILKFQTFVLRELDSIKETFSHHLLLDVFYLEDNKFNFSQTENRSNLQIYLDNYTYKNYIIELLNKSDEWINSSQIRISNKVKIVNTKWDWVIRENFNFIENFYKLPGLNEYLFLSTHEEGVAEYSLKIDGLVLHRFDEPKSINQALAEIKYFCQSQPEEIIKEFTINTGSLDVQDFIKRLDFLVTHKIKQFLYDGILEFI